jgi:serine/threonine protein kinase
MSANSTSTPSCDSIPLDRGDFVDSDHEGDIEGESEDTLQHDNGYFYPVRIGDILNERYRVVHKLGRGGFSTVWLAHHRKMRQDVALKILSSAGFAAEEYEAHLRVAQRVRDRSRLVLSQDKFVLSRTDGSLTRKYVVLVLPLLGPSLSTLLQDIKKPLSYRMSAAKQLLHAVFSIHDAGLVHRGKSPKNDLLSLYR